MNENDIFGVGVFTEVNENDIFVVDVVTSFRNGFASGNGSKTR